MQREIARFGEETTRTTLADWVVATAMALEPLYRSLCEDFIAGSSLKIDDTPVRVMNPELEGQAATGCLLVYARPGGVLILDCQKS